MKASTVALGSLLACVAIAQPHRQHHEKHHKRDNTVVWVTDYDYVTETVAITTTVWVSSGFVPPTSTSTSASASSSASLSQVPAQFFEGAAKPSSTSNSIAAVPPTAQAPPPSSAPPVAPPVAPLAAPPAPPASVPLVQSSSAYVPPSPAPAPAPVPAPVPAPAPAPAYIPPAAPPVPASPPAALPATGSGSSAGDCSAGSPCKGDITYYTAGLGACGYTNDGDAENLVALPHELMGTQSNGNPYCGKTITITSTSTGKTTTAKVVDKCMGCVGYAIDLSNKAFLELDDLSVGRTGATWHFN